MGQTILCVSRHSAAQVTRNLVLERAGYRVLATDNKEEALQLLEASGISAVVLGETLRTDLQSELGKTFKRTKPAVPVVLLCRTTAYRMPLSVADAQVEYLGGPQVLLRVLDRLLGNAPESQSQSDD